MESKTIKGDAAQNSVADVSSPALPAPDSFTIYTAAAQAFGGALQDYTDGIVESCREETAAFCDAVSKDWQATCSHEGMVKAAAVEYIANHLRQTDPRSKL